jgi:dTDP-4-dehydrorhamnose reductase
MRILILGGTGMLGHQLFHHLSYHFPDTYTTIRQNSARYKISKLINRSRIIDSIDVTEFPVLTGVLKCVSPDVILNCIGVTKRRKDADEAIQAITLNALLPHQLAEWGRNNSAKVINFSTDCVFDGKSGNYVDDSATNAVDLYGKTKAVGEIHGENALTLRSSFIGAELDEGTELLEWFLAQTGTVKGFKNAIYSGLTTLELSRVIEKILVHYPSANGIYNVSSDPISKYELLVLIRDKMHLNIEVIPDENMKCDRSLNSFKFRQEFDYSPPSWKAMINELASTICLK